MPARLLLAAPGDPVRVGGGGELSAGLRPSDVTQPPLTGSLFSGLTGHHAEVRLSGAP